MAVTILNHLLKAETWNAVVDLNHFVHLVKDKIKYPHPLLLERIRNCVLKIFF